jgi:predicted GIY-YIG superfamily endonuclease
MYFVYVLRARKPKKKKYYIGVSNDLVRRLQEHNSPFNTGYTRDNKWEIVYIEGYLKKYIAYEREHKLKQHGNVWYSVMKRVKKQF